MGKFLVYKNAPLVIAVLVVFMLLGAFLLFKRKSWNAKREEEEFLRQLEKANNTELYNFKEDVAVNIFDKFSNKWGNRLKEVNMVNREVSNSQIGLIILLLPVMIFSIVLILSKNLGLSLMFSPILNIILKVIINIKKRRKDELMSEQILPFLAILKSNIQANSTPERALIDAVDMTTSPLYDEIKIAKAFAQTANFSVALERLRETTTSKEIRFLCSCIELSSKLGANLEDQIVVIENIIKDKKELARKIEYGINENKNLAIIGGIAVPGIFLVLYMIDENTRKFWFKVPVSWYLFIGVLVLVFFAFWLANYFIRGLDKFKS